jgi:Cyclin, N-terminal domain
MSVEADKEEKLRVFYSEVVPLFIKTQICEEDQDAYGKPQLVAEFQGDIFKFLMRSEQLTQSQMGYISEQPDISERMRAILVDWLIEVHLKFKLRAETLFLTVNLIDRFLSRAKVERSKLQLVGVTAMMLASKYEEIYPPQVADFAYITDKAVTN